MYDITLRGLETHAPKSVAPLTSLRNAGCDVQSLNSCRLVTQQAPVGIMHHLVLFALPHDCPVSMRCWGLN